MNERIPAYEGREPYIFVSYAHKNSDMVMPIIDSLYNDKYRVWYDEGIAPGSEWPKNIEDHLKQATVVVVFVSKESLESLNCENEIVNSNPNKRKVIQYSLDGSMHSKLVDCDTCVDYNELKKYLNNELIGDGISGYKHEIGKVKNGNYWTGLIVFAFILIIVLAIAIYGLNVGWFNSMLPSLDSEVEQTPNQEVIITSNNVLTQTIAGMTNEQLVEPVTFESQDTKECLYEALNLTSEIEIKYQDLVSNNTEELVFENASDELLGFIQYFSNLKSITILSGKISSLEPLLNCAHLTEVKVHKNVFPLIIPNDKAFNVVYINK